MTLLKSATHPVVMGMLATALILGGAQRAIADYQSFRLSPGFVPDPQVGTGYSGGERQTEDCGFVGTSDAPDHVVQLNESFEFLRISVQAPGDVTLLVEGPDGRYCSDDVNGLMPQLSGAMPSGTYRFWIGNWGGSSYRYSLYFSEN